jgi:energy-coupling factor transport system ATP-binding protein
MLQFEQVYFAYSRGDTIQDVSFKLEKGEFAALLGENGAGKSTLARLCNGLLKPSAGTVRVNGQDTRNIKVSRIARRVGFLFQNPDRQICQNTVRAEILFGLETTLATDTPAGSPEPAAAQEQRCQEILARFSLDGSRDPFGMSRGERQQVALASVLARRPELLILDEPTTGLDYRECTAIMEIISQLHQEGATILMISHDMEVVADYSQRALVLSKGRLIGDGPVRGILRNRELLAQGSLLPAQIPALAMDLGPAYDGVFTINEMVARVSDSRPAPNDSNKEAQP